MNYKKLSDVAYYSELRTRDITIENYITTDNMLPTYRVGYPVCTGGRNEFPKEIFEVIDFYEALSGEIDDPTNIRSIKEYREVNKKYGISATYGRDWHADVDMEGARYGATLIISEKPSLSIKDVLEHVKAGKTAVVYRDENINILEE